MPRLRTRDLSTEPPISSIHEGYRDTGRSSALERLNSQINAERSGVLDAQAETALAS
jgi:hypothetical protein